MKSNDEIYKMFKQVIRDNTNLELNLNGQEAQLLAKLEKLTQDKFLEQIAPFITIERAQFVRKLCVDEGLTWRGIAEAWEKKFAVITNWKFNENQLAGMAICELAAKFFNEDYMKPPWN